MSAATQHQPAIVSQALRDAAAGETCTVQLPGCMGRHGVVLAHIRMPGTGWSRGRNPDDLAACLACAHCCDLLDARKPFPIDVPGLSLADAQLLALFRTHRRMWERGLLIIPDTARPDPYPYPPEPAD